MTNTLCCFFSAHYFLPQDGNVSISSSDLNLTRNTNSTKTIEWSFNTPNSNRIMVIFYQFDFWNGYDFLEIGDGLMANSTAMIAKFSGDTTPSDVISVHNVVWLRIILSNSFRDEKSDFFLTVTTTHEPGMFVYIGLCLYLRLNCVVFLQISPYYNLLNV